MAWFVDETQLTQAIILELIRNLGAGFPEQLSLQAMAQQGAEPREIGSKIGQIVEKLRAQQNELEGQKNLLEDSLTQARRESDIWRHFYDVELLDQFQKAKDELSAAKVLVTKQARQAEADSKEIETLENTLVLERRQASEYRLQAQSLIEEQNRVIAAQHQKLVHLLDND